ncbi:aminoacyl-tRNA hydrolase [Clostridium fermenticellae]|uniref:Peptidyl-tRNA hydrolase n=1 Tax=Clostridium fermenticellae TaxID=2068654 RepID=A0A386H6J4_9CLOT|nr:aminoacyl-tRNA hydrolase [Clostridium fermenticellae]AYD41286.1 aminoacyl-tRNA hydrolase [Clostridium fermenticellae]
MFLIVGLGNIGSRYTHTRHNVGFDVVDLMSNRYNISINREKFKGMYGEGKINNEKVVLLKPGTYMNLSGESVIEVVNFYKIPSKNVIVIHDDIDLSIGRMRIRNHGSAGGHNGIKNVIYNLNTEMFSRIRIGIGQPEQDLISHVLGKFSKEDRQKLEKVFELAADAVECLIKSGVNEAMNEFNGVTI